MANGANASSYSKKAEAGTRKNKRSAHQIYHAVCMNRVIPASYMWCADWYSRSDILQ